MVEGAPANVKDYGALADGTTNDAQAISDAINSGAGDVFIPKGTYYIDASALTVDNNLDSISIAAGDGSYLAFPAEMVFIPIVSKKGMTIKCAEGVKFLVAENTSGFGAYGCTSLKFIGGELEMQGTVWSTEACGIVFSRCATSEMDGVKIKNFWRGGIVYRCISSGITNSVFIDNGYFGPYVSSVADIAIDDIFRPTARANNYVTKTYSRGGGQANFFCDNCLVENCTSYDEGFKSDDAYPTSSNHFQSQFGYVVFRNNLVEQGGNLETGYAANASNPGTLFSSGHSTGISAGGTLWSVRNITIEGNTIRGCRTGITVNAVKNAVISNNEIDHYWLNGINLQYGDHEGVIIKNNYFGVLHPDSTAAAAYGDGLRAGISFDADTADSPHQGVYIDANIFDTGTTSPIATAPSAGSEGFYVNDSNIIASGTTGVSSINLVPNANPSPYFGKIKTATKSVTGGTAGAPVLITPEDSGMLIIGTGYIQFPPVAGSYTGGQYLTYDVAISGNGSITMLGDSGTFDNRVSTSSSGVSTDATVGITLSGSMFARVVVGEVNYQVYYYSEI